MKKVLSIVIIITGLSLMTGCTEQSYSERRKIESERYNLICQNIFGKDYGYVNDEQIKVNDDYKTKLECGNGTGEIKSQTIDY